MSALDRLPALATTGVGSLPFGDPARAARHAVRAYELPFCPQLPRLDGDMIREWLGGDPGRCGWNADRDRQRPAAWDAFVAQLAAKPPEHGVVKLQVTGPVTLAVALERAAAGSATGAPSVALAREVAQWLAASAGEQIERLGRARARRAAGGRRAGARGRRPDRRRRRRCGTCCATPARPRGGCTCAAPVPWGVIDASDVDVLSFDVARHGLDAARPARAAAAARPRRARRVGRAGPRRPGRLGRRRRGRGGRAVTRSRDPGCRSTRSPGAACSRRRAGRGRLSERRERLVAATLAAAADGVRAAVRAAAADRARGAPSRQRARVDWARCRTCCRRAR